MEQYGSDGLIPGLYLCKVLASSFIFEIYNLSIGGGISLVGTGGGNPNPPKLGGTHVAYGL